MKEEGMCEILNPSDILISERKDNPAGSCIVATAKKDNLELIAVVLGGETTDDGLSERNLDCITLFNYGFDNYKIENVNKANDVLQNTDPNKKAIYSIDYTAYVNGNILSLVIMSTLKESTAAQRIIVQTYNYNLSTNTEASLIDLLTLKQINRDEVNSKIMEVVTQADEEDKALQNMGYNQVYMRDLTSDIYTVENAGGYFLGPDNTLYIVYAYGNGEFTSKMDIILFE